MTNILFLRNFIIHKTIFPKYSKNILVFLCSKIIPVIFLEYCKNSQSSKKLSCLVVVYHVKFCVKLDQIHNQLTKTAKLYSPENLVILWKLWHWQYLRALLLRNALKLRAVKKNQLSNSIKIVFSFESVGYHLKHLILPISCPGKCFKIDSCIFKINATTEVKLLVILWYF